MNSYHIQIKKTVLLNGRYVFVWAIIAYENGMTKAKTIEGLLEEIQDIEFNHFTITI